MGIAGIVGVIKLTLVNNKGQEKRISIIVPTLNEAQNIMHVFPKIPQFVDEIIVIDGNSSDGTIEKIRKSKPDAKVIIEEPKGKGKALKTGFDNATGDIVVMLDADGSHDPSEMKNFIDPLLDGYDVTIGSRMLPEGGSADLTPFRRFGNTIFVSLVNKLYGSSYTDLCYGYRAFKKKALKELNCRTEGFDIETEQSIRIQKAGLKVKEIPSYEAARLNGESNLNSFKDGMKILKIIIKEYLKV